MSGELIGEPTLVESSICKVCSGNYLLRGEKYVQLIEVQRDLRIVMREPGNGYPPQRVCMSIVPLSECIRVCTPCWLNEQDRELRKYALAPFAGYIK